MKTPVAVTLIVAGTVLIIAPMLFGYLYEVRVSYLLTVSNTSVTLLRGVPDQYNWAALFAGALMIAAGARDTARAETAEQAVRNAG